jgi:4-hydroxy-3-polyprenylbenzoate decarboxylase
LANPDLRDWIAQIEAAGELQRVNGAERMEEIGGIVDLYMRSTNRPALLFDEIPGYPKGYRVLGNILTGVKRIALTFGMSPDIVEMDLVHLVLQPQLRTASLLVINSRLHSHLELVA